MLHASAFYKNDIKKYFNCKACENVRLAKHRDAARYVEEGGCCCFCCPACKKAVNMEALYDREDGVAGYIYYDCSCGTDLRFRSAKKADARTGHRLHPAQGRCQRCMCFQCKCKGFGKAIQRVPKIVISFDKLVNS